MDLKNTAGKVIKGSLSEINEFRTNPSNYFNSTFKKIRGYKYKWLLGIACWLFLGFAGYLLIKYINIVWLIFALIIAYRLFNKLIQWAMIKLNNIKYKLKK
jgi:hypothetical protein